MLLSCRYFKQLFSVFVQAADFSRDHSIEWGIFPVSALALLVWRQEGHPACKNWMLVCWWWRFDWSFARLIAPTVTTTVERVRYVCNVMCLIDVGDGNRAVQRAVTAVWDGDVWLHATLINIGLTYWLIDWLIDWFIGLFIYLFIYLFIFLFIIYYYYYFFIYEFITDMHACIRYLYNKQLQPVKHGLKGSKEH